MAAPHLDSSGSCLRFLTLSILVDRTFLRYRLWYQSHYDFIGTSDAEEIQHRIFIVAQEENRSWCSSPSTATSIAKKEPERIITPPQSVDNPPSSSESKVQKQKEEIKRSRPFCPFHPLISTEKIHDFQPPKRHRTTAGGHPVLPVAPSKSSLRGFVDRWLRSSKQSAYKAGRCDLHNQESKNPREVNATRNFSTRKEKPSKRRGGSWCICLVKLRTCDSKKLSHSPMRRHLSCGDTAQFKCCR